MNITDNSYHTKNNFNTSNITNNTTIHINNNYGHNVIDTVNKHINQITNYDTEINHDNETSLNTTNYCNFYNDNYNFRNIENISLSQQTYITNNITETNAQTINYVDNNCLDNNKIVTIIVNPTPSLN